MPFSINRSSAIYYKIVVKIRRQNKDRDFTKDAEKGERNILDEQFKSQ